MLTIVTVDQNDRFERGKGNPIRARRPVDYRIAAQIRTYESTLSSRVSECEVSRRVNEQHDSLPYLLRKAFDN